jgi:membrane-associated phospholipid phosphatase
MLGHEPQEVIGGAIFGVLTGALGYAITKKDRKMSKFTVKFRDWMK